VQSQITATGTKTVRKLQKSTAIYTACHNYQKNLHEQHPDHGQKAKSFMADGPGVDI